MQNLIKFLSKSTIFVELQLMEILRKITKFALSITISPARCKNVKSGERGRSGCSITERIWSVAPVSMYKAGKSYSEGVPVRHAPDTFLVVRLRAGTRIKVHLYCVWCTLCINYMYIKAASPSFTLVMCSYKGAEWGERNGAAPSRPLALRLWSL